MLRFISNEMKKNITIIKVNEVSNARWSSLSSKMIIFSHKKRKHSMIWIITTTKAATPTRDHDYNDDDNHDNDEDECNEENANNNKSS